MPTLARSSKYFRNESAFSSFPSPLLAITIVVAFCGMGQVAAADVTSSIPDRPTDRLTERPTDRPIVPVVGALPAPFTAGAISTTDDTHSAESASNTPQSRVDSRFDFGTWQMGVNFNFEVPLPLQNGGLPQNRLTTREAAFHAHGLVDNVYEAYLNFRAHDDTGTFLFELREGWLSSHLDESHDHQFKIGKFALTIDAVNSLRPSERPFITSPFVQSTFFAVDQELDTGVEYHWHHDLFSQTALNFFLGVTSGYCYGDCSPLNLGQRPLVPAFYAHPNIEIKWNANRSNTGVTYLGYTDADSTSTQLIGFDELWTSRSIESGAYSMPLWIILLEGDHRSVQARALPIENQMGGFLLLGRALSARLATNLRFEVFKEPTLRDQNGDHRNNLRSAISPFLSYSLTPHTRLRGQYTWGQFTQAGSATQVSQAFGLQFVADLGALDFR